MNLKSNDKLTVDNPYHPPGKDNNQNGGGLGSGMCPDPLVKRQVQNPGDGHNEGVEHLECKQLETGITGYPLRHWRPESELYCWCFVWGVGI